MKKLIRIAAVMAAFAGFAVPGVVSADNNGPKPPEKPSSSQQTDVDNDTSIRLHNYTSQFAASGSVEINSGNGPDIKESRRDRHHHQDQTTSVAGVTTGSVSNENATSASVSVSNSNNVANDGNAPTMDVRRDGPRHAQNGGGVQVDVDNDTEISICNSTSQEAISGSVSINGASEVKNVTTGDASNSNTTALSVSVSNDTAVE